MSDDDDDNSYVYEEYVPPTLPPIEIDAPGKRAELPIYIIK